MSITQDLVVDHGGAILRHTKRTNWGRAVQVWESRSKRGYQFEDGALRVFKVGYYHLLETVDDLSDEEATRLAERLHRQADRADAPTGATATPLPDRKERESLSVAERLGWFNERYEDGFKGDTWNKEVRGAGMKRKKRSRTPLIEDAQARLDASLPPAELMRAFADVVDQSDLLGPQSRAYLTGMDDATAEQLGEALAQLIDGDVNFRIRFERWLDRLQVVAPTLAVWAVATAPLSLIKPTEHVFIRRTVSRREAALNGLVVPNAPSAPAYEQLLQISQDLFKALVEEGAEPTDLIDIYDFTRVSLSPAATKAIKGR